MSMGVGIPENMRELAQRAAKRDYPRACPNRGEITGMVEDPDLPPGIRLKEWACRYWEIGVTWKTCAYRSKKFECHIHTPDEVADGE